MAWTLPDPVLKYGNENNVKYTEEFPFDPPGYQPGELANFGGGDRTIIYVPESYETGSPIFLIVDTTLSERESYRSKKTSHPIESGSLVTDHIINEDPSYEIEGAIASIDVNDTAYSFNEGTLGNKLDLIKYYNAVTSSLPMPFASLAIREALNFAFAQANQEDFTVGTSTEKPVGIRALEAKTILDNLWESKNPFSIVSGLKTFHMMVFTSLEYARDASTGDVLLFRAGMERITVVDSDNVIITRPKPIKPTISDDKKKLGTKKTDAKEVGPETLPPENTAIVDAVNTIPKPVREAIWQQMMKLNWLFGG